MSHHQAPPPANGFTSIELLVTMAVMAILLSIAAPSFRPLIERWRVKQASEDLKSALLIARVEGIKHGGGITMTPISATTDCALPADQAGLWSCGWLIFADDNGNGTIDDGEKVLQSFESPRNVVIQFQSVIGDDASELTGPIFADRWGQLNNNETTNFSASLAPRGDSNIPASFLCISGAGHIKSLSASETSCT